MSRGPRDRLSDVRRPPAAEVRGSTGPDEKTLARGFGFAEQRVTRSGDRCDTRRSLHGDAEFLNTRRRLA